MRPYQSALGDEDRQVSVTVVARAVTILRWYPGETLTIISMINVDRYCGRHEKWQRFTAIRDRCIVENRRHRFILCFLVTSS